MDNKNNHNDQTEQKLDIEEEFKKLGEEEQKKIMNAPRASYRDPINIPNNINLGNNNINFVNNYAPNEEGVLNFNNQEEDLLQNLGNYEPSQEGGINNQEAHNSPQENEGPVYSFMQQFMSNQNNNHGNGQGGVGI